MIGTTVGSYQITAKVAVGGMGTVYKAEHTLIGKQAAVKVLHPELRGNEDVVQRFFHEAKATTQIKHPGIVEVFDFGYLPEGDGYIVMEFLEGESLAGRLKHTPIMDEGEAAYLLRSVCSALAAAHAKGIIHRDLKPDNIFLCPDPDSPVGERPKILDFGIAKLNMGLTGDRNATKTGAVMGTPTYMSPEQCKGVGAVDHRADLYSLGCIYYECVAGRPPFTDMGAGELIGAHVYVEPVKPSTCGAKISEAAENLIMSLLAKNPEERPQTAIELGREFGQLASNFGLISRASTPIAARSSGVAMSQPTPAPLSPSQVRSPSQLSSQARLPSQVPGGPVSSMEAVSATLPSGANLREITTLSGAASQSIDVPKRSRRGIVIGVGAALAIAAGSITFVAMRGPSSSSATPAAHPTLPAPAPTPAPTPAPAPAPKPPPPTPAPVATPEAAPTPAPEPPKPVATPAKPTPAPPKKPKPPKPEKAKGSAAGSASGILLETDI